MSKVLEGVSGIFKGKTGTLKKIKTSQKLPVREYTKATLRSGDMRAAVKLPKGETLNEWLAVNTVDFFNEISLLYGTVTENCTDQSCTVMCATSKFEYWWAMPNPDDTKKVLPQRVTAPQYVAFLMAWVGSQLNDENIFPLEKGNVFPKDFKSIIMIIFRRLFRIFAHIYHHHWNHITEMGAEAHFNTTFKHFIFFSHEHKLIVDETELTPLKHIMDAMLQQEEEEKGKLHEKKETTKT